MFRYRSETMKLVLLTLCFTAVSAGEGEPGQVTATVTHANLDKAAMQASAYMNQYCSVEDHKMSGTPYRSQFAPDLDQCINRCNRDPLCSSLDFSADKTCNQHNEVGEPGEELDWTHYHRRTKTESGCPEGTTQHVMAPSPYSNQFCVYAGKKCPGHDLYRKSQNIADTTLCMTKCAKIKSCASADFKDGKCNPKDHACSPDELVEESGATYMQRLEAGVEECVCVSGYTRDAEGVCQPDPVDPCDGNSPQEIDGVAVACHNGNIVIHRNAPCGTAGRLSFSKNWADYKAGFGDTQNHNVGYWAGLDFLHTLTTSDNYRVIIEIVHQDGTAYTVKYDNFVVGPESDGYRLSVGAYSGTAGDAWNVAQNYGGSANGSPFSTPDVDRDDVADFDCAYYYGSGWWFSSCHRGYLTGPCPGEPRFNVGFTIASQWFPVAWGVWSTNTGRLDASYMTLQKM